MRYAYSTCAFGTQRERPKTSGTPRHVPTVYDVPGTKYERAAVRVGYHICRLTRAAPAPYDSFHFRYVPAGHQPLHVSSPSQAVADAEIVILLSSFSLWLPRKVTNRVRAQNGTGDISGTTYLESVYVRRKMIYDRGGTCWVEFLLRASGAGKTFRHAVVYRYNVSVV